MIKRSRGRISEVAQYYEADVVNTYRLWLVYEALSGHHHR
jgi:hypothetical protein